MSIVDEVRRHFAGFEFGRPCTPDEVADAERELGHPLPAVLRELCLAFNGFLGPTAAEFFSPLVSVAGPGAETLVSFTLFLRGEDYFPSFLQKAVIFGGDGCGANWGMLVDSPDEVFEWHPEQGEDHVVVGASPLDAWLKCKALYDEDESAT